MPIDPDPNRDELFDLLEMRVTRLERIVAAQTSVADDRQALKTPVSYSMDDPRLILFGAYPAKPMSEGMMACWFGRDGQVQMVFPHGRRCWQHVRFLLQPYKDADLTSIRIFVDEAKIIPKLTREPKGFVTMEFRLPPAYGFQTDIQMQGVPLKAAKDYGDASDTRVLSFCLYRAEFSAIPEDEIAAAR